MEIYLNNGHDHRTWEWKKGMVYSFDFSGDLLISRKILRNILPEGFFYPASVEYIKNS